MSEAGPEGMTSAVVLSLVAAVVFAVAFVLQSNPIGILSMVIAGTAAMRFAQVFQRDARRRATNPNLHIGHFERELESLPLQSGIERDRELKKSPEPKEEGPDVR